MTLSPRSEAARMLVLAMTSYRGSKDGRPRLRKHAALYDAVEDALSLPPLEGDWRMAWGPGTYRARFSPFDDSMMYVARRRSDPSRLAVIIRGTNSASLFDWIWGDLWTGALARWTEGSGPAGVSLSTSLGLSILTTMRGPAPPLPDAPKTRPGEWMPRELPPLPPLPELEPIRFKSPEERARLRALRERLNHDLDHLWRTRPPAPPPHLRLDLRARVARVERAAASPARASALQRVKEAQQTVGDRRFDVLRLMESRAARVGRSTPGTTLVEFLRKEVQRRGRLHVSVTGHSKGAALAVALGLWLAERQGGDVPAPHRWDPEARSEVDVYGFAGPTAGNEVFAQRAHDRLGAKLHRVVNRLDMVPNTWTLAAARPPDGLCMENIPALYGKPVKLLTKLLKGFKARVEPLRYAQPKGTVTVLEPPVGPHPRFLRRVGHHHTGAYLEAYGLHRELPKDAFNGGKRRRRG